MSNELNWTIGRGYAQEDLEPSMTLTGLELVERVGVKHVYRGVNGNNKDRYFVTFHNQPEIRQVIKDNEHYIFGIGSFKLEHTWFSYNADLSSGETVAAHVIARITPVIPGNKDYPRSIQADPSGIIVK
jgi:hypothetical protein